MVFLMRHLFDAFVMQMSCVQTWFLSHFRVEAYRAILVILQFSERWQWAHVQYGDLYSWGSAESDVLPNPCIVQAALFSIYSWQGANLMATILLPLLCNLHSCYSTRIFTMILPQLGSLCKGLVKVGRHLERNSPHALNRLQASVRAQFKVYLSLS